jgi:hypothetical protein
MEAIQQAVREPLSQAPHDCQQFAIYIFERARAIDHEKALADQVSRQRSRTTLPGYELGTLGRYAFQRG